MVEAKLLRLYEPGCQRHRGLNVADKALRVVMRNRVGASLRGLKKRGTLDTSEGAKGLVLFGVGSSIGRSQSESFPSQINLLTFAPQPSLQSDIRSLAPEVCRAASSMPRTKDSSIQ